MRLKVWNYISRLILVFLFALSVSILIEPWLNALNQLFSFPVKEADQYSWIILVIMSVGFTSGFLERISKKEVRSILILAFIFLNILILRTLNWSIFIFAPFLIILILIGFRFRQYSRNVPFNVDFFWGIMFLFFNLSLNNKLGFGINYEIIIIFFLALISLAVLFNFKNMAKRGYTPQYKIIVLVILTFTFIVISLSFLLGAPLKGEVFQGILSLIAWIYHRFADLILLILYPFVRLLAPLMELIMNLEPDSPREPPEREPAQESSQDFLGQLPEKESELASVSQYLPYIFWGGLIVVLIIIVIYVASKLRKNNNNKNDRGIVETTESVFTLAELQNDLKSFWLGLKSSLAGRSRQQKLYNRSNSVIIIREIYYRFLCRFNDRVSYKHFETPDEYLKDLNDESILEESFLNSRELTDLYKQARYGEKASLENVKSARKLWDKIQD